MECSTSRNGSLPSLGVIFDEDLLIFEQSRLMLTQTVTAYSSCERASPDLARDMIPRRRGGFCIQSSHSELLARMANLSCQVHPCLAMCRSWRLWSGKTGRHDPGFISHRQYTTGVGEASL